MFCAYTGLSPGDIITAKREAWKKESAFVAKMLAWGEDNRRDFAWRHTKNARPSCLKPDASSRS
jgi:hypothetical protein